MIEIYEKAVVRFEVVCDEHGLITEESERRDAEQARRAHEKVAHLAAVAAPQETGRAG